MPAEQPDKNENKNHKPGLLSAHPNLVEQSLFEQVSKNTEVKNLPSLGKKSQEMTREKKGQKTEHIALHALTLT